MCQILQPEWPLLLLVNVQDSFHCKQGTLSVNMQGGLHRKQDSLKKLHFTTSCGVCNVVQEK